MHFQPSDCSTGAGSATPRLKEFSIGGGGKSEAQTATYVKRDRSLPFAATASYISGHLSSQMLV